MSTRLTLLSVLEVAGLAVALIFYLYRIVTSLERIGGLGNSYLARIRFGVRAIEKETGYLGPEVMRLNGNLAMLDRQLSDLAGRMGSAARAVSGRKEQSP